jgi:hypothetical protein
MNYRYYQHPKQQVTVDNQTVEQDCVSTVITLLENGLPSCNLVANNYKGKLYLQNLKLYSKVVVKFAYEDNGTINWSTVNPLFTGRIVDISPELTNRGETLVATALDGECWKQVRVNKEYENQLLRDIIVDVKNNYISKLLNDIDVTLPDDFVSNVDYVYNYNKQFPYMNFPFTDGTYVLNELIKIGSSLSYIDNGANFTGLHWTVLPNNKLAIAPVGNHSVYGANSSFYIEDVWSTRSPLDPIVVKEDMIQSNFKTEIPLANVVLIAGKFVHPTNDLWTESLNGWNESHGWTGGGVAPTVTLSLNNTTFIKRDNSLQLRIDIPTGVQVWVELYRSLQIDFTKLISEGVNAYLNMLIYGNMKGDYIKLRVYCNNDAPQLTYNAGGYYEILGSYFEVDLTSYLPTSGTEKWHKIELPITSNDLVDVNREKLWTAHNDSGYPVPSWSNIKWYVIFIKTGQGGVLGNTDIWLFDDVCVVGNIVRGAYTKDCGQIDVANDTIGCIKHYGIRSYTVKDSLAQTDSLNASNDNNTLGQVALYELLRHRIPRTTATIQVPLYSTIKAGQIVHIHACQYLTQYLSVYKIDRDFRISKVVHQFSVEGCKTMLDVTDDIRNSLPINNTDPYTVLLRAVNPDTQTKTFTSLKQAGSFETGMKVLWKQYNT